MYLQPIKFFAMIFAIYPLVSVIKSESYTYQCYNGGITCTTKFGPPIEPKTVEEIQEVVRDAEAENITVKVIGSKHSISDCICTTGKVIVLSNFKQFSYDNISNLVTAGTGMETVEFLEKLHEIGCGISGAPTFGGVTLGGALAIGVHGTGVKYPTLFSDQVYSLSFVDGQGILRFLTSNDDPKIFNAVKVSLGLIGIIYEAQFKCQPQYKLTMHNFPQSDEILRNGAPKLLEWALTSDVIQFWWFPTNQKVLMSLGNRTSISTPGNCQTNYISNMSKALSNTFAVVVEGMQFLKDHIGLFLVQSYALLSLYQSVPGRQPFYSESDGQTICLPVATGWSHKMMSNKCTQCTWEQKPLPLLDDDTNVAIPLRNLPKALEMLRTLFENDLIEFPLNGLYFRFLKSGNGFMAINYGEKEDDYWVSTEWITVPRWDKSQPKLGIKVIQLLPQILINLFEGRPHWGKAGLAYSQPDIIRRAHGNKSLEAFIAVMNIFDPKERFMNTFGQRIKFGKNVVTVAPNFAKHCALNECCFCEKNSDCGNEIPFIDYNCRAVLENGFKVCQPTRTDEIIAQAQNATIHLLVKKVSELGFLIPQLNHYGLFTAA